MPLGVVLYRLGLVELLDRIQTKHFVDELLGDAERMELETGVERVRYSSVRTIRPALAYYSTRSGMAASAGRGDKQRHVLI